MKLPPGLLLIAGPVIFVASTLHVVAAERAIEAQHGMVVTVSPQATDVGVTVLQHGGNAVDAAVAVAFALAVTWPAAGNIGGGGFMLVYPGVSQKPVCIEYREMAPAAATVSMLRDYTRMDGLRVCATPGTVAGLALAHRKYGKLPWRELTMPAVRLARDGIAVDAALAKSLNAVLCTIVNLVDFGMDVPASHRRPATASPVVSRLCALRGLQSAGIQNDTATAECPWPSLRRQAGSAGRRPFHLD